MWAAHMEPRLRSRASESWDDLVVSDERMAKELGGTLETYEELFAAGKDQRALDKEPLREWFVARGFRGDGPAPAIPDEVRLATASRDIALAEEITQRPFEATPQTARDRVWSLFGSTRSSLLDGA